MNPDDIIAAARAHFDRLRGQSIEVPEWGLSGEKAATFDPPTLKVRQLVQHQAGKSDARLSALIVIHCLKSKDGKKIFVNDAPTLAAFETGMDPVVIGRVANRILSTSPETDLGN